MFVRLRVVRLAAVSIAIFLTVPQYVGVAAETQTRDSQQANVETARALLAQAIAQEKETPTKDAALAADEALQRFNEAMAAKPSSAPGAPADDVGVNTTTAPIQFGELEPNNTSGTATPIGAALNAARYLVVSASINPMGDLDFFTFTATAGSRIWIETDTGGLQNPGATSRDTVIDLLAADGTTVIETDDEDGTGNGGDGTDESGSASLIAGRTLTAGGTYFIRVRGQAPTGIINPYRLFVANTNTAAVTEAEGNTAALASVGVPNGASLGLRSGAISPAADVDYYSVAATAGSIIYYAADGDPERDGTGTDLVVELRSPADELLHTVDSSGAGNAANPAAEGSNFAIFADGVYFIKVRHAGGSGTGTYHLMIAVSVPAEDEPNNTAGTAEPIDFTSTARRAAVITGAISPAGDVDYYSFQAAAGSRVWIEIDTGGPQNTGATSRDTVLDLLASDGVTVIENDDDDGTGNGGDGTIETSLTSMIGGRTLVTGGTYFLRVTAFSAGSPTFIINPYKLFVVVTNSAATAEVESNDTAATANLATTSASPIGLRAGTIGSAGDADFYSLVADAGSVVYFNVDADPERDGAGTDLVVELRSAADVVLLSVDSSITGSPANPAAEGGNFIVLDAGGAYYLKVRHFSATGTGTYHLMAFVATGKTVPAFTDSQLIPTASMVRAIHFAELRSRINALRVRFGLAAFAWSQPSLTGAIVDADDMTELRTALQQAYTAAGRTAAAFTDPTVVAQSTVVRAVHIDQLRTAVIELESS
jgi:hypothetical protein